MGNVSSDEVLDLKILALDQVCMGCGVDCGTRAGAKVSGVEKDSVRDAYSSDITGKFKPTSLTINEIFNGDEGIRWIMNGKNVSTKKCSWGAVYLKNGK